MTVRYNILERGRIDSVFKMIFEEELRPYALEKMMDTSDSIEEFIWSSLNETSLRLMKRCTLQETDRDNLFLNKQIENRMVLATTNFFSNPVKAFYREYGYRIDFDIVTKLSSLLNPTRDMDTYMATLSRESSDAHILNKLTERINEFIIYLCEEIGITTLPEQSAFCLILYQGGIGVYIVDNYRW